MNYTTAFMAEWLQRLRMKTNTQPWPYSIIAHPLRSGLMRMTSISCFCHINYSINLVMLHAGGSSSHVQRTQNTPRSSEINVPPLHTLTHPRAITTGLGCNELVNAEGRAEASRTTAEGDNMRQICLISDKDIDITHRKLITHSFYIFLFFHDVGTLRSD